MEFTPWSVLTDAGLIAFLLVVGVLVRSHVRLAQQLMLPASVIAGFLGLLLGPNGLGLLPFSDQLGTYTSILIVPIFACLALASGSRFREFGKSTANLFCYSLAMYTLQVGVGVGFALLVLGPVWDTPDGFGALLFGGWAGGFGTAAALGSTFEAANWEQASSLGFTSATVGMLIGIIGGVVITNWGARRGHCAVGRLANLPPDMRTGLVRDPERRGSTGTATTSPGSIEPMLLQLCVVAVVAAAAYGLTEWVAGASGFEAPTFAVAFVVGLVVRLSVGRTPAWRYVDPRSLRGISGSSTDVLIVCGIASIVPSFVVEYWVPLTVLFVVGLALCLVLLLVVAPRLFAANWFEKALFTWGWATGAVATGIALLRMSDPDQDSRTLEEFGVAYLPVAPVETATVTFVPAIVISGTAWALGAGWTAVGLVALALPWLLGWNRRRAARESHHSGAPT